MIACRCWSSSVSGSTYRNCRSICSAVSQAVDGIAIKLVAEDWVNAPAAEKEVAFRVAEAVRHIEIGLIVVWPFALAVLMWRRASRAQ